jgi:hypothetical protein
MPWWLKKYTSWMLVLTMVTSFVLPSAVHAQTTAKTAPAKQVATEAPGAESAEGPDTKEDLKKGEELSGLLNTLLIAGSSSPILVRVIGAQLRKYGNHKMASWARESYYLVGQAVAAAERTGTLNQVQGQKAKLYQEQFGRIMKEAGWIEKVALRTTVGNEKLAMESAAHEGKRIARKTYQGEVANLQGEGFINDHQAKEFIDIQRRGIMTPRELGGFLLRETELSPAQVAELLRTYRSSRTGDTRVRVTGGRDARYDSAVLETLENWKGKKYARFSSQTSREAAAKYLTFQGTVNEFTKLVMGDGNMSGADSAKLIDEFALEAAKDQAFFGKQASLVNDARPIDVRRDASRTLSERAGLQIDPDSVPVKHHSETPRVQSATMNSSAESAPKMASTQVADAPGPKMTSTQTADVPKASVSGPKASGTAPATAEFKLSRNKSFHDRFKDFSKRAVKESGFKEVKASISSKDGFLGYKGKWTGGGIDGIKESIKYDAFRGGLFVDVGISAVTGLISRMSSGDSLSESLKGTLGAIASTEFVFGDLLGGTLGAAVGAAIPLPAALQTMGAFGRFMGALPGVGLAIAGSQFGYGAVSLMKRGQFSFETLFNEVKPGLVIGQAIGAAVGMTIGTMLLPGPIGAMLGGIVGGMIGSQLATMIFGYRQDEVLAQVSHTSKASGSVVDVGSRVEDILSGINVQYPDSDDMRAVDKAVKDAYSAYIKAQKSGDYNGATAAFKDYNELSKVLNVLLSRGYRVK